MLSFGPLAFATPLALAALLALPALWWLLRVTPPAPRRIRFPPVRLLARLRQSEESLRRTPLWLLALRLVLVGAVILGAARPLLDAAPPFAGTGPVVLIIDDGWAAAKGWSERQAALAGLIDRAERQGRPLVLLTTAPSADDDPAAAGLRLLTPGEARERARRLTPKPWPRRRAEAVRHLRRWPGLRDRPPGAVIWLSDGLGGAGGEDGLGTLAEALRPLGTLTMLLPEAGQRASVLRPPERRADGLAVRLDRADRHPATVWVRALAEDGGLIARQEVRLAAGARSGEAAFRLPSELRNRLARLEIEGEPTAAAVVLVDERWRRRRVGLITEHADGGDLPLLSELYYVQRALAPFAEVRRGGIDALLRQKPGVLVLGDGEIADAATERVRRWLEKGGVLLRFAGPRLASARNRADPFLPVALRTGDRVMGGALAWRQAARLAPFAADGPFAGITVPDDVEIDRQVLAEPSLDLHRRTWARLADGTPLVTAARHGKGWVVLVHTTANAAWSNLPLSGLFVEMLERIVALGRGRAGRPGGAPLPPVESLDGFGRLAAPPPGVRAIAAERFAETEPGPRHPPGLYGKGARRRALNLGASLADPVPVADLRQGIGRGGYAAAHERDLRAPLWGLALALAILDLALSLAMRGLFRSGSWLVGRRAAGAAVMLIVATAAPAQAQTVISDGSAPPAALTTHLAYLKTGDAELDAVSRAGLNGLAFVTNRRTAAHLGPPVGVDPATDELAFYPLLYWPLRAENAALSARARQNLARYLAAGGTIVFDTGGRDGGAPGLGWLARALRLPVLIPLPADHVLGRSYYLLNRFPGRWPSGTVWVTRSGERLNDGVSPVIVGGADWAAAWAVDDAQRPLFPVVPGGERQREMAYRFGINLVMYVLTGNYKADQVHLPAILERLGRNRRPPVGERGGEQGEERGR